MNPISTVKKPISLILLCSLAFLGAGMGGANAGAIIEGHVTLPDKPSVNVINKRYQLNGEQVVIAPDPPAAVVYLRGSFPPAKTRISAEMVQKNIDFVPRLLPIQVGTTVEFPNQDPTYHSIFSFSPAKRFDLGRYRSDEKPIPAVTFDKPGAVVLHCDIHESMRAIILVLETPYFAKTDSTGNYRLTHLPAGVYQVDAWLNSKVSLEKPVTLKNGEILHVDFP
jgi:plastocyanin